MLRIKQMPFIIYALYGLLAYAIGNIIVEGSFLGYIIKLLAVLFLLWVLIKSPKQFPGGKLSSIITIFVWYTVFIIARCTILGRPPVDGGHVLSSPYSIIQYFFWNQFSTLSFLVILFILVPFDPRELRYYRTFIYVCLFICLIGIINYKDYLFNATIQGETGLLINGRELSIRNLISMSFIGLGAILLFVYNFKTFKRTIVDYLPVVVLVLYFLACVAGGGRGGSITAFVYCVGALFFYLQGTRDKKRITFNRIVFAVGAVAAFVYLIWHLYQTGYFDFLFFRLFEGGEFGGELNESSRETYIQNLKDYLHDHPAAWIFGRGSNGYYTTFNGLARSTIETGYWYLILKGGIIYLVLYVYILLKAAYVGFFKSNNQLAKTMGVLCLIRAYMLIPFGLPEVSIDFVLIWHYVRLINTDTFRNMEDDDIKELINGKQEIGV